jgi:hypothetical protein
MVHKSPKSPRTLLTLAEVMAREAADPEQRTVGPMYQVVVAKRERMVRKHIDFERHPKALYVRPDADGQAVLKVKGHVKTPRVLDLSGGDPLLQSAAGMGQLQQLIAVYRRKHGGNALVEQACEDLRQLCLAARDHKNQFPVDRLCAALKVLHDADHPVSPPTLTGHISAADIVDLPPEAVGPLIVEDIERLTPRDTTAADIPTTVPAPPVWPVAVPRLALRHAVEPVATPLARQTTFTGHTPHSPRPLRPQPVPQSLRVSTVRTTPRTPPGSADRNADPPPEPQ